MIKVYGNFGVIFGLSEENIKRLKKGHPIQFNLNELNVGVPEAAKLPDLKITIFAGTTEKEMARDIMKLDPSVNN